MHDDISRMTAKEAAEEASLMHGKVYTPLHLRLLYIGELLLFWLALFLLMRWLHHHSVILMVCFAGIVLFLAVIAFLVTVKSFSDSITYDGFDGEITCRSPFHRKQVYRFEQLQFVERLGVQRREDDIHWEEGVRGGGFLYVQFAQYEDLLRLSFNDGRVYQSVLRRSAFQRAFRDNEGADTGVVGFDRWLRLRERSRHPEEDAQVTLKLEEEQPKPLPKEMPSV